MEQGKSLTNYEPKVVSYFNANKQWVYGADFVWLDSILAPNLI